MCVLKMRLTQESYTVLFFYLQGSAKLEKAEILQLTVDHLKMLHAKGNHFAFI